ncbi:MAG: GH25 family lysozyme [Spirosomataceae bacterium]
MNSNRKSHRKPGPKTRRKKSFLWKWKFNWKRTFLIFVSPIVLLLAYFYYQEIKAGYIKYKAFGIYIPSEYSVHGIDVSRYQQIINWKSVKNMEIENVKIEFAFIKATQGVKTIDYHYLQNKLRAKNAGLVVGAYHFFVATKSPQAQAELFIRIASIRSGDLPPVVDVETEYGQSDEKIRKGLKTWLRLVENHYGVKPIIYTNADFYKQKLQGYFDNYPIWVAHYTKMGKPDLDRDWHFWQISEESTINGIKGKVDFNVFNGTREEFEDLLIR